MRWIGLMLVLSLCVTGCSVGMAMSGSEQPDLGAIHVGSSRGSVEMQLGSPDKSTTLDNGHRIDTYKYEVGNEPSAGRAAFHGAMDIATLGFWEIIGTPVEGFQGDKRKIVLKYDEQDKVAAINPGKQKSNVNLN